MAKRKKKTFTKRQVRLLDEIESAAYELNSDAEVLESKADKLKELFVKAKKAGIKFPKGLLRDANSLDVGAITNVSEIIHDEVSEMGEEE